MTSAAPTNRALIVVDVQPTFCEGGELGVAGGNAVAQRIADFVAKHRDRYAMVVTTQDWHINPGRHFAVAPEVPDFVDTWPPHGIADTPGAQLHPALNALAPDASVKKGAYQAAYSGFDGVDDAGRPLADILTQAGISQVDVVGIAESHCVRATALDAQELGLDTRVFTDLTVPVSEELGEKARVDMLAAGVELTTSGRA